MLRRVRRLVSLAALALAAVLSCSCVGPADAFVAAERGIYEQVASAHRAYVEADVSLDAEQKARRMRLLESWNLLLRKAEGKE